MLIQHFSAAVESIVHKGEAFVRNEAGVFDVPVELAERLLHTPGWSHPVGILVDRREGHETYPPAPAEPTAEEAAAAEAAAEAAAAEAAAKTAKTAK